MRLLSPLVPSLFLNTNNSFIPLRQNSSQDIELEKTKIRDAVLITFSLLIGLVAQELKKTENLFYPILINDFLITE